MLSICDTGPFPPCPQPFNMAAHVLARASDNPNKIALSVLGVDRVENWTYAEVETAVLGIATGFLQRGLTAGDRILFRLGNTPHTPLAYLAAIAVDLIPVPTSSQLTETEVARIIAQLDPALILHDPDIACPAHNSSVTSDILNEWQRLPPAQYSFGSPDRHAYIVFTSGTSGKPQAVQHAHRAIWARQMMIHDWYELKPTDRVLHAGAFNWTYTMGTGLMDPWSIGATSLIPAPEIAPNQLPEMLRKHRATIFAAAPGVFRKFLMSDNLIELPDIRHALSAGEKLGADTRHAWKTATGTEICEAFGMSECSTFISSSPSRQVSDISIGHPQNGRIVALLNEQGHPVTQGQPGVIAVHKSDPGLMLGYLDAPKATKERFSGDWFVTGDYAVMAENGEFIYQGRHDDMMNAGGYRVSPSEVEAALAHMPGITALAVTEIEVKSNVRVIMGFYTSDEPLNKDDLLSYAEQRLARYKQPRDFIRVDEMPTGPNGKLRRSALKQFWSPHD